MAADGRFRGYRITGFDRGEQVAVLLGQLRDAGVAVHQLRQQEPDLGAQALVCAREPVVSGALDDRGVEREIRLDPCRLASGG